MQRRHFIAMISAAMGTSFVAGCRKELEAPLAPDLPMAAGKGGGGAVTRFPLKIPGTANADSLQLTAAPLSSHQLGGNRTTNAWAYNGQFPGPTLRLRRGDRAVIDLNNGLAQPTITHWHGMIVRHEDDGHPMHAINPGATARHYDFVVNQRAALNWYHPHPHMMTGEQVYMGLAGAFIINDAEEDALKLPSGAYEVPLIIRDASFDKTGRLAYRPRSGGFLGQVPLVNGTLSPYLEVNQGVYRFRILNGANSRIFGLTLSNASMPMLMIGNDGGLLPTASNQARLDIANGERLDVLIDFRSFGSTDKVMLRDARTGWDLLEFRGTGVAGPLTYEGPVAGASLSSIAPLTNPVAERVFSFDAMSRINGQEYGMERIDWTVTFGQTERWIFTANGNAPHPVHVHGASFQVQSRKGGRGQLFPWEAGWKDTVLLEDGETVEVFIRFEPFGDNPEQEQVYLLHCHKLEHEDMGMMANFKVVPQPVS